ncbi:zinc-dependent metalloprotease [Fibrella aquatilis]|uniref:Zinc-dependent metalloprotease n=1 Tax=Fibrella aquatilis TaxID=2817059 RepID=A0A939G689_9BACT|nr:zinc-dependent metalloprotease [Fibrella aquatilis]MBO0931364.1 zinc-dependent metalloprotease [Fibrella aquatilis]
MAFCLPSASLFGQQTFFESAAHLRFSTPAAQTVRASSAYLLSADKLRSFLEKAPLEFDRKTPALRLNIPLPDGTTESFQVVESPILAPAIAAQNPTIKTYSGTGTSHPTYSLRFSLTPSGFDAIVLGVSGDAVYVTKTSTDPTDRLYLTYFARDVIKAPAVVPKATSQCGTNSPQALPTTDKQGRKGAQTNVGTTLRTFKLAVAATGEFTAQRGGGDVNAAYTALVAFVNRMNAVYRRELSVAFTLVSGVGLVYPNAATDPYTNTNQITMLGENQTNLDNVLGNAAYDVGHVISYEGGSGGGIASSPSACVSADKGKGVSGVGNPAQFAPVFDDQLLSHEVGHQFGMSHTFNSSIPVCTTREATTSVEPGAGTTIMSYGFTCSDATGNDDYEAGYQPFLNFHTVSYEQAVTYINTLSCFTSSGLGNAIPVITSFPTAVTIPKSTPFMLSGTATDADAADVLSYAWEGTNIGTVTPTPATLANTAMPPFSRSYPPVSSGTRTYPRLEAILNGSNYAKGDKLASVGVATNHRLTVRDNVGGVTNQSVTITVDGGSGPFLETTNLAGSYPGNSVQTITWDVANTTAPPVNCAAVDILLSTDGGQTFPTTLLSNTPNDGTEPVTLPTVLTSTARIKVKGSNTIFFDISNVNFSITASLPVELMVFRAEAAVNQVRLSWSTASEHNSDYFTVERSQQLGEFGPVGNVTAARESAQIRHYGLNDDAPLLGTSYYRLRQTDRDGQIQFSKPVAVTLDPSAPLLLVSPNPVSSTLIRYQLYNMPTPDISLSTLTGKAVAVQVISAEQAGSQALRPVGALPVGVYILRAVSGTTQLSQRVLVTD